MMPPPRTSNNNNNNNNNTSASLLESLGPYMMQLLRYLPLVLKLLSYLPGFIFGFIIAWFLCIIIMSYEGIDFIHITLAPIAGFHITGLLLLRELYEPFILGKAKALIVQERVLAQRSFARDVQLQWREKLD